MGDIRDHQAKDLDLCLHLIEAGLGLPHLISKISDLCHQGLDILAPLLGLADRPGFGVALALQRFRLDLKTLALVFQFSKPLYVEFKPAGFERIGYLVKLIT